MADKSPFGMSVNEGKMTKNNRSDMFNYPNDLDAVFAQLTDMFGELIPSDVILNVCVKCRWDCKLKSLKNSVEKNNLNESFIML